MALEGTKREVIALRQDALTPRTEPSIPSTAEGRNHDSSQNTGQSDGLFGGRFQTATGKPSNETVHQQTAANPAARQPGGRNGRFPTGGGSGCAIIALIGKRIDEAKQRGPGSLAGGPGPVNPRGSGVRLMVTTKMPFGKYKDWVLGDVPEDYLAWVLETLVLRPYLRRAIQTELNRREYNDWLIQTQTAQTQPARAVKPDLRPLVREWFGLVSRRYHPDRGGTTAQMQALNAAREELDRLLAREGLARSVN